MLVESNYSKNVYLVLKTKSLILRCRKSYDTAMNQCFCCSQNIGYVTTKIICFHQSQKRWWDYPKESLFKFENKITAMNVTVINYLQHSMDSTYKSSGVIVPFSFVNEHKWLLGRHNQCFGLKKHFPLPHLHDQAREKQCFFFRN